MSKKVLFILPLNELSGSCVSALNLAAALRERGFTVDFICPAGNYLSPVQAIDVIGFNLFNVFKSFIKIKARVRKSDLAVFFTVRTAPLAMFFGRQAVIYLHEIDVKPRSLFLTVAAFIKLYFKNKFVVNPAMEHIFGSSLLLPNFKDFNDHEIAYNKSHDFIMVANCTVKKGVLDFVELAKRFPEKTFILLTVNSPNNSELFRAVSDAAPSNLVVMTDQERKAELISGAKFLLNLSHLDETFGLTLLEAVALGTIPLSFENTGSRFFYESDKYFLVKDQLNNSISGLMVTLEPDYFANLNSLQVMVKRRFSSASCVEEFKLIFDKLSLLQNQKPNSDQ